MKKIIVVLSLVLTLSVVGCITVFSVCDSVEKQTADPAIFSKYETKNDVQLKREISMKSGMETVSVVYKTTVLQYGGGYMDVYLDEAGNEYWYDENGSFYAYTSMDFNDMSYIDLPALPEDKAKDLACEYASEIFGDAVSDLEFEDLNSYNGLTYVELNKKYGENANFKGSVCLVTLKNDGGLFSCSCKNVRELEKFDENLLKNVTSEDVTKYAKLCAEEEYKEYNISNVNIPEISVVKKDGGFALSVLTEIVYLNENEVEFTLQNNYYYELEK